jgi:hypothetical protein
VSSLKVLGMTVLSVLAVISIRNTGDKDVLTELPESTRSMRNNSRNRTSSQSSNSSKLPNNSAKSGSLDSSARDSIHLLPLMDSLAGNRIHGLPNITQPRFKYL